MMTMSLNIIETPLKDGVNGVLAAGSGRAYTIILNSNAAEDEKALSFLHECLHIYHQDIISTKDVEEIEKARHEELKRLLKISEQEAINEKYERI